jgi:hypothetical protein
LSVPSAARADASFTFEVGVLATLFVGIAVAEGGVGLSEGAGVDKDGLCLKGVVGAAAIVEVA